MPGKPFFRKIIVPWYDTTGINIIQLIFSFTILLFSVTGIIVAAQTPGFHRHIWLPSLLSVLSITVAVSTGLRLMRRHMIHDTGE